jgi:hypothetical protein
MLDSKPDQLDARDLVEIKESLDQMQRGEVIGWREYSQALRKKYLNKTHADIEIARSSQARPFRPG